MDNLDKTLLTVFLAFGISCAAIPFCIKALKKRAIRIENYDHIKKIVVNNLPEDPLARMSKIGAEVHNISEEYCPDHMNFNYYKSLISISGDTIKFPVYKK